MVSIEQKLLRGGAVAARRAHNPKVVGSNPAPATKLIMKLIFYLIELSFLVVLARWSHPYPFRTRK
jgi:hypothetical protein